MKRIFFSIVFALASLPLSAFACGAGDCSMDLPPPEVPAPGAVENLISALSAHSGLCAGMALAAIIGGVLVSRQRKLLATESALLRSALLHKPSLRC